MTTLRVFRIPLPPEGEEVELPEGWETVGADEKDGVLLVYAIRDTTPPIRTK